MTTLLLGTALPGVTRPDTGTVSREHAGPYAAHLPGRMTVTLVRRAKVVDTNGDPVLDDYGNDTYEDVSAELRGCLVEPRGSSEDTTGREQVVTGLTLRAPSTADIRPTDGIVVDGVAYEVDGEVGRWNTPRGRIYYLEAALTRVRG